MLDDVAQSKGDTTRKPSNPNPNPNNPNPDPNPNPNPNRYLLSCVAQPASDCVVAVIDEDELLEEVLQAAKSTG